MTSYAFISELNEPWVLITEKSIPKKDIPEGILFLELDAFVMTKLEGLYQQFASVFMFPDYFGKNFNALDECITDLEWLPANGYLLIIKNSEYLLCEEPHDVLESLLSILNGAGNEWATPVAQGEAWDRQGLPFHTVLELDKGKASAFLSRLKKFGFELEAV